MRALSQGVIESLGGRDNIHVHYPDRAENKSKEDVKRHVVLSTAQMQLPFGEALPGGRDSLELRALLLHRYLT